MINLDEAIKLSKADHCIITTYRTYTENIRWANSSATTNGLSQDDDIVIISVINKSVGTVAASLTEDLDIKALVLSSEKLARQNPPAEDYTDLIESQKSIDDKKLPSTDISPVVTSLGKIFKHAKDKNLDLFGYAELRSTSIEMINSSGVHKSFNSRVGQIELNVKSQDRQTSVWDGQSITSWEEQKIELMFDKLLQKVKWSEQKIDLEPGDYTVLLEPSAVTDLLVYAYWESAARDADEGRTVFSKLENVQAFDKNVSIYSDPKEQGLECTNFVSAVASSSHESVFDNGATISKNNWILDGKVAGLFSPRYYAKKSNRQPTYFSENLIFSSEGKPTLELISDVKDGLLITCFWYIREVDPQKLLLTGLTRDGVFLIKDGEVVGAVNNFRFNMSPIDMLKNIKTIGKSEKTLAREFGDYFKLTKMPPLIVEKFNMSTKSDAL
ncbi:TldD/PmbA family protein [Candidatus Nomurabacteria bacterium]|nr:TldD/PmbA family protein [Candidatus Nomurabacteria bacterium]